MKTYWEGNSGKGSLEEMMLDSRAKEIDPLDLPEVLSLLPDYADKDVIELGAGIG